MKNPRTVPSSDAIDLGTVQISVSDFVSQGNAVLGIRDSGKSYTATYLAEQLLCRDIPFVAFDPIGVWRFLRHGKRPWDVLVAGGVNGDVPLTPGNCVNILRHAMSKNIPLIFDLYSIELSKADWRRIVEACIRVLLYENKSHGPRHVFIEEAAEFVPQMVQREHGSVYAEIEKLARMGGNAMLGYTLINQRAEQVNKAVLELCDCLFLHRQKGRLSLTALSKWLDFGDRTAAAKVIGRLPILSQGECFVWKGGEDRPIFTKIPEKQSFHPNRREHTDAGQAVPVPHMIKGIVLDDPKPAPKKVEVRSEEPSEPAAVEVPVFAPGDLAKLESLYREFDEKHRACEELARRIELTARELNESLKRAEQLRTPRHVPPPRTREEGRPTIQAKGPQRILSVLAARHPLKLSQNQLGTLSGFTPSTMRTYLPGMRAAGLLDETADGMGLTREGLSQAGKNPEKMPTGGRALLDFWKVKLSQGEATILETLFLYGKAGTDIYGLKSTTQYTDSTIRTYLPSLRRNNLIDPTELRISPEFLK